MSELQAGDKAPEFKAKNQNGEEVSINDFKGQKLVLYFYPKDDTPGCTREACNLRDNYRKLNEEGFAVVGVSPDDVTSHEKFAGKFDLPFDLLADPDKEIINKYGVWGEKNMYGKKKMGLKRTTFVIDEEGKIAQVFKRVKTDDHTNQILEKMN